MTEATSERERSFRVLIVDDNQDAADSLSVLLRMWGYDAQAVYDGEAGLAAATAFEPDCLFLDIGLPRIDGYDLARQIRAQPALNRAKLVALSAYSGKEHGERVKEAGFDYQLIKPADPTVVRGLLKMLNQVMELASRTEQLAQRNVELAQETKELLGETKGDLKEMRQEIQEVREELKEVKEEIRDVKETITNDRPETGDAKP